MYRIIRLFYLLNNMYKTDPENHSVYIDTIHQRAADAIEILLYHAWLAGAFLVRVVVIATRAGIHSRHQHETSWKINGHLGP